MPDGVHVPTNVRVPGSDIWAGDHQWVDLDGGCYEVSLFVPMDAKTFRLYAVFWGEKEKGRTDTNSGWQWIPGPGNVLKFKMNEGTNWPKACLFMWFNGEYIEPRLEDHDFDHYNLEYEKIRDASPYLGTTITWRVKPWNNWAKQTNFRTMLHLVS